METGNSAQRTTTATATTDYRQLDFDRRAKEDRLTEQRINDLVAVNRQFERDRKMFGSEREKLEAALMKRPLSNETVFSRLGLLLGAFPSSAIFGRLIFDKGIFRREDVWFLGIAFIVCLISSTVGYFSGKSVGRAVYNLEEVSWSKMIVALPFIGALWGGVAGGAGGIIIFLFGGLPGAIVGGAVGALALTAFTIFHRIVKRGDQIDEKHFLPLAFGTTLALSAFVLGL